MTFYDLLGLSRNAAPDEIRAAYRALAKQYHPDLFQQAGGETQKLAEERLKAINEAYQTLRDPKARARYHRLMWTSRDPALKYKKLFPAVHVPPPATNGKEASPRTENPAAHLLLKLQTLRADREYLGHRQHLKRRRFIGSALVSTLIVFFIMWMENAALSTTSYDLIPLLGSFLFTFLSSELIALPIVINASALRIPRYPGVSTPAGFSLSVVIGSMLACAAVLAPRTLHPVSSATFLAGGLAISLALLIHLFFIRQLSRLQETSFRAEREDLEAQIRQVERQIHAARQPRTRS